MVSELQTHLSYWLIHYGSFTLFGLLALGIIGLPIPDETLLLFSGYMMAHGKLSIWLTPICALLGSMFGITVSYLIGYFGGRPLILRFGRLFGITEERLNRVHQQFDRFGKWLLLIGYFIPGVRHLIGIVAGIVFLRFWEFALLAYTGALIWTTSFLVIGFFFHNTLQEFIF
ncbi:DedA family protein (plasmid) [Legionella sp. D16C41]|uniref:DedA family protein n=1 Tax=Legionella sp. D16C41 TaxID=3402688 RepID=UPI003AF5814D